MGEGIKKARASATGPSNREMVVGLRLRKE